jgi:N-acyl-D-aspartate/D-glutamate deacylase
LEIAPTFQDEEARATLLDQAQVWLRLAHLALANRQIAELAVQIARQRAIVKYGLDTGQRSEMTESLLDALEGSLRLFEKHRIFLLSCSVSRPSKRKSHEPPK